jgi:N-acyl homoserine lactone hydrolase
MQQGAPPLSHVPDRPAVQVLCEGCIVRDGGRILDASSSVVMISTDESHTIVDTGAFLRSGTLTAALESAGVRAEEIDVLVNTHLHMDHCGCNDMFVNARRYAHPREHPPIGTGKAIEGSTITDGVSVIETPGHTGGSISVVVRSDVDYVICGDALPTKSNYESMLPPAIHIDRRLALLSMERIIRTADIVVPGHDAPFRVMGKK